MALLLGVVVITILFLFVLWNFSYSPKAQAKPEKTDPGFENLFQYVDQSLKGYPDRFHYTPDNETHAWTCLSRLFTIRIFLKKETLHYEFKIFFTCVLPFEFKIQRTLTGNEMKILQFSDEVTKGLIAQKEIPALIQKLSFYDSLQISENGVAGAKKFHSIEDLSDWPRTLGASITFVRFLLNYQDRKESTEKGPAVCPYCRNPVVENEKTVSCRECRTIHHFECWNETDRCSVFGCGNKAEIEL